MSHYDPTDAQIANVRANLDKAIEDLNLDHSGVTTWILGYIKSGLAAGTDEDVRRARAAALAHDQWAQEHRAAREEAGS